MNRLHRDDQLRRTLAVEAARLMAEQGITDFLVAKRKAAERFQVREQSALPNNSEIEAALREHQRLFQREEHPQHLQELRRNALRLMRLLIGFNPRLTGAVLSGSATAHSKICLHLFTDRAAEVSGWLLEQGIEHRHTEKKFRYPPDCTVSYPGFSFVAGQQPVELVVFPVTGLRLAPRNVVDGKPMPRADLAAVQRLLDASASPRQ